MNPARNSAEVVVLGAGPTGLVLSLWVARLGVRVRVIDKNAQFGDAGRDIRTFPYALIFPQNEHERL